MPSMRREADTMDDCVEFSNPINDEGSGESSGEITPTPDSFESESETPTDPKIAVILQEANFGRAPRPG